MHQVSELPAADRREHPRVAVPLEVELDHPCIGRRRCRVRDVSEEGLFLEFPNHQLLCGARMRVTPVAPSLIGHDHCPTVEIEVARTSSDGIGARFANRTGAYLFTSFRQRRTSLAVGIDYFQVHLAALITDPEGRLLVVDDQGRWLFPATFLVVGHSIEASLAGMLEAELGVELEAAAAPVATATLDGGLAPEGATLALFHPCTVRGEASLQAGSRYRRLRWLNAGKDPSDLVFADPELRRLARQLLLP
ncbi:MAG: PilZ domain-containing protein [Gammaproteobacteria bacterium]|nr:PilZ domain-containing protein [Gammaproteobacteria bacterium]